MKKSSFFQKRYSESSTNCLHFYHFLEPHCHCFRLKNLFLASNGISSAFKTSLLSHRFATKQLRVAQVTPITLQNGLKVKTWFQTSQNTSWFWKLLEPSKKAFFEMPTSNFKSKSRVIYAFYDKVVHMFWVVYDQGFRLIVTRALLDFKIIF